MTRTRLSTAFLSVLILLVLAPVILASSQAAAVRPSGLTDQQWREDIDTLARTVAEKHRHPF
ncbi:MAG: hypothetical protein ACXWFJ_06640, partial [Candidatus Aminicenantales bacterium]